MAHMRFAMLVLMLLGTGVTADTEIHRCLLQDGTFAFQETPCPEPAADSDAVDPVNPIDEPANPSTPSEPAVREQASKDRSECEKTTRDAIDDIDFEMQKNAYSQEQGQEYLAELLELTRRLRACKQL